MRTPVLLMAIILASLLLTAGCTSTTQPPASEYNPTPQPGAAWKDAVLTDLSGRGTFSIAGFSGKVVIVPVVSVSCPTCIPQLNRQVEEAQVVAGKGIAQTEVVVLDLDPATGPDFLTAYGAGKTFTGRSAWISPDLASDIFHRFGPFAVDTQAIPVILVCPDGRDLLLPPGFKTSADLGNAIVLECMT